MLLKLTQLTHGSHPHNEVAARPVKIGTVKWSSMSEAGSHHAWNSVQVVSSEVIDVAPQASVSVANSIRE
jgi:hypothetical protein